LVVDALLVVLEDGLLLWSLLLPTRSLATDESDVVGMLVQVAKIVE
jgi:hypothetical protein